jgi:hypothetical protein
VLHKVVMTLKNLLGLKDLAGLPLLYAGLPISTLISTDFIGGYSHLTSGWYIFENFQPRKG